MTTEEQSELEGRLQTAREIRQRLVSLEAYAKLARDDSLTVRVTISQTTIEGFGSAPDCVHYAVREWLDQCRSDLVAEYQKL